MESGEWRVESGEWVVGCGLWVVGWLVALVSDQSDSPTAKAAGVCLVSRRWPSFQTDSPTARGRGGLHRISHIPHHISHIPHPSFAPLRRLVQRHPIALRVFEMRDEAVFADAHPWHEGLSAGTLDRFESWVDFVHMDVYQRAVV